MAGRYDKIAGVWNKVCKRYDKVNGVWQPVKKRFVKADGVWRQSYSNGVLASIYEYQWCYIDYPAQRLDFNNVTTDGNGLHMNARATGVGSSKNSSAYMGAIFQIPLGKTLTFPANTRAVALSTPLIFNNLYADFPLDLIVKVGTAVTSTSYKYYNNGNEYNNFYDVSPTLCSSSEVYAYSAGTKQFTDADLNNSLPTVDSTADCIYLNITWDATCGAHKSYRGEVTMDVPNGAFVILPDSENIPINFS